MICKNKKCKTDLPEAAKFCFVCGRAQEQTRQKRRRGNGTGSIIKRKDNKSSPYLARSSAEIVLTGKDKGKYKSQVIGHFATVEEAQIALVEFNKNPTDKFNITLEELYKEWKPIHYNNISKKLQENYNTAWRRLEKLYNFKFRNLRTAHFQNLINYYRKDHPEEGKNGEILLNDNNNPKIRCCLSESSLNKIKALISLLYKYALENTIVDRNYAEFLDVSSDFEKQEKTRFSEFQIQLMHNQISKIDYLDYIYILCYTGHRINEFLSMTSFQLKQIEGVWCLLGGNKTKAGKNKILPLHSKIVDLVLKCAERNGDTLFCNKATGKKMTDRYFRENYYYTALHLAELPLYSPHSCRRSFLTMLSKANVNDDTFIRLAGHADKEVGREHYIIQEIKTLDEAIQKIS